MKEAVACKNILKRTYKFLITGLGKLLFPIAQQFLVTRP